ncbi:MAG TPA: hypothetical protein VII28_11175 [Puia sp.]
MEIIIYDNEAYQHSLEQNRALWAFFVRKNQRTYLIQYGIGILLLIFGLFPVGDWDIKTEHQNEISHQTEIKTDKDSTSIALVAGIIWIILVSASLFRLGKAKVAFMDEAGYRGRIIYKNSNESKTILSEGGVKYENPVGRSEYKWATFLTFFLYRDYVFLNFDRNGRSSFLVDKQLVPADKFEDLLNLIRQNVREGKA